MYIFAVNWLKVRIRSVEVMVCNKKHRTNSVHRKLAPNGIQVTKTGAVTEPWSKAAIVLYMWSRSPWWLPRAPGVCVFVCCAIYALWVALRWSDVMLLPLIGLAGGRGLVDCANRSPREQRIELLFLYGFTLVTPKANFQNSC